MLILTLLQTHDNANNFADGIAVTQKRFKLCNTRYWRFFIFVLLLFYLKLFPKLVSLPDSGILYARRRLQLMKK